MEKILVDDIYDLIDQSAEKMFSYNPYAGGAVRNQYFRGKKLDLSPTQLADRCTTGKYKGLFIGDYITVTINYNGATYNVDCIIAGFNSYQSIATNSRHVVMIAKRCIIFSQMGSTTDGRKPFKQLPFCTNVLPSLDTSFYNAFDQRIIESTWLMPGTMTSESSKIMSTSYDGWEGVTTNWESVKTHIRLPYCHEVSGHAAISSCVDSAIQGQLPLFHLVPTYITDGVSYWCMEKAQSNALCQIRSDGIPYMANITSNLGIRPVFLVG